MKEAAMDGVERTVACQDIRVSPDLQIRALISEPNRLDLREDIVTEYAELLAQGVDMGRLAVVMEDDDEDTLLLADGFHRLAAMQCLGRTTVDVLVYPGTRDDAVLLACELNAKRGLQYNAADKRKVAERYLDVLFRRGQNPSDSEVARRLGLSRRTIERARAEREAYYDLPAARQVTRSGMTYQMEPRQAQPPAREVDDMDSNDASAYERLPAPPLPGARSAIQGRYAPPASGSVRTPAHPARSGSGRADPVQTRSDRSDPAIEDVTFAIQWSYADADGQPHIGITVYTKLAELPPAVRARVLRDLAKD